MNAPLIKTRSEQKLEWLEAQRAVRRLTNEEWEELARAEHAIYCRNRTHRIVAQHRNEELALLREVERESCQPDCGEWR